MHSNCWRLAERMLKANASKLRNMASKMLGRGLHSSTSQLNVSAFCEIGVRPGVV